MASIPLLLALLTLAPPESLTARDAPDDEGGSIELSWRAGADSAGLLGFRLYRFLPDSAPRLIAEEPATSTAYTDSDSLLHDDAGYCYFVRAYS
ncbi:hypothetical protein FJY71_05720, partial [candidate division WOR-3 bacterium]|nr:hypothetical protein [candidate division WOR-3 bacterium]